MPEASSELQTVNLSGVVQDASGVHLPSVTLTLNGPDGPQKQLSGPEGDFRFSHLVPTLYQLTAELKGYGTVVNLNLMVRPREDTMTEIVMGKSDDVA